MNWVDAGNCPEKMDVVDNVVQRAKIEPRGAARPSSSLTAQSMTTAYDAVAPMLRGCCVKRSGR